MQVISELCLQVVVQLLVDLQATAWHIHHLNDIFALRMIAPSIQLLYQLRIPGNKSNIALEWWVLLMCTDCSIFPDTSPLDQMQGGYTLARPANSNKMTIPHPETTTGQSVTAVSLNVSWSAQHMKSADSMACVCCPCTWNMGQPHAPTHRPLEGAEGGGRPRRVHAADMYDL